MKWRKDDCLTRLFGEGIHEQYAWLKNASHNDVVLFVTSKGRHDRLKFFQAMLEGQAFERTDKAEPGTVGIGDFVLATPRFFELPMPWFALMQPDGHWLAQMVYGQAVVAAEGEIEYWRKMVRN